MGGCLAAAARAELDLLPWCRRHGLGRWQPFRCFGPFRSFQAPLLHHHLLNRQTIKPQPSYVGLPKGVAH